MQRTVVVAGGGISGLTACYHLAKSSSTPKIILLEGSSRLGGWLLSTRTDDGAVFEHGPRGIRPAGSVGKNTLNMVSELGLEDEILPVPGDHSASKNRYLYVNKALHKLPSSISGVLRTIPPFSKPLIWCGLRDFMAKRGTQPDETVHEFVVRRLGKEVADIAIDSLCRGVFAGDCRRLSLRSCFPILYEAERKRRSIILGMVLAGGERPHFDSALIRRAKKERWSQWSLRSGMETLPEAMEEFLRGRGVQIYKDTPLQQLERTADNRWKITLPGGSIVADHLISAVPAKVLSQLLPTSEEPLAKELRQIEAVSVGVVNLQYEGMVLPVEGFGHLVPSFEDSTLLGIVYDSVAFPDQNHCGAASTRLTVMMGGAWFEVGIGDPDKVSHDQILCRAREAVTSHLGISETPTRAIVKLHKACIPQYTLGHWQRTENIFKYLKHQMLPLSVVGASYEGVSVNDCIFSARNAVEKLFQYL
ncbi:protoporphyrinogen oxidase isoform X1 [Microcaecilia unicolor]|uniref:Protoporphyrinogen oxidase n=1 Tax=Microcaecilia unicolor TaxID=1415580 RepID=A0A6P7WUX0_9AMPH|nr:protoporphyrinogen oxidase isoform X1 [Microcaecilia unicolor]XP_030044179.1 protoporphyrinogen oxidase isoform X1 [Microcaecilia unicolor]XP_030044180.1 protoporphyrinogen oxidase isoform X1 [Microcaecilia unicolor]